MKQALVTTRHRLGGARINRHLYRRLPAATRCKECQVPFDGVFSLPFRMVEIRPSRKNPSLCTLCYEFAPAGGETREISVMFVDVRGFTALAERIAPAELAERLNYFYWLAADIIFRHDGTLDKLVGDQVMAFFNAPVEQADHQQRAVHAALEIVQTGRELSEEEGEHLHVGAGVATGEAFVGNVGSLGVTDYTALGDTVNVAARLQGLAAAGEVLLAPQTYAGVATEFPDAATRELELRGRTELVQARVITIHHH